jgi:hypothetical protein
MGKADEYRQLAAECIYMAQEAGDAGCRVTLIDMANVLLRLADHHLDLVSIRQRQAGVDRQLDPGWKLDRQIARLGASEPSGARA